MSENQDGDNFLIGFNAKGEKFTEENMPWYRGENGEIVFKQEVKSEEDVKKEPQKPTDDK